MEVGLRSPPQLVLLTAYNGQTITYDAIGNPLSPIGYQCYLQISNTFKKATQFCSNAIEEVKNYAKNTWNKIKSFFNKKFLLVIFILLILLALLYIVLINLLKWAYLPPKVVSSIDIYTNGDYLDFESGKEFQTFINDYALDVKSTPSAFYYVDNSKRDSFIYGKMCDIYILENIITEKDSQITEEMLNLFESETLEKHGRFELFSKYNNTSKIIYSIAIDKENGTLRYIMIDNASSSGISDILTRQCTVSF